MKTIITSEYKNGQKGTIIMESTDSESGELYAFIQLDDGKIEVFFEKEYEKVDEK
jgi:aspartokinase